MSRKSREPVTQDAIVRHVRDQILEGKLSPGERLPARSEYLDRLGASSATLQKAFTRLIGDGFVCVRGKGGTYVAEHPPHLHRYALAFPHSLSRLRHNLYYSALAAVASRLETEMAVSFPLFFDINRKERSEDYRDLLAQAEDHRLAGIVFVGHVDLDIASPLLTRHTVPRVALAPFQRRLRDLPVVELGGRSSFFARALDCLSARGRRRIALVTLAAEEAALAAFQAEAKARGLEWRPYWIHVTHEDIAPWTAGTAHLMFRRGQPDRPDGLVVADDHLVPPVCTGLVQAGVSIPEEVDVVAHCNYPALLPSILPLTRLGFDNRQVLLAALDVLRRQMRPGKVPARVVVEPLFESELEDSHAPSQRATPRPRVRTAGL